MSIRNVESGFFGAKGVSDPVCFINQKVIGRSVDFSKTNVAKNKAYPLMAIPKGFCVTNVAVEQVAACDADTDVTFGLLSDDSKAVGGTFALKDLSGETSLCRDVQPAKTSSSTVGDTGVVVPPIPGGMFFTSPDMLCLVTPNSGNGLTKGKINVYLIGFETFGDGVDSVPANTENWRAQLQTQDNVSGGQIDPAERKAPEAFA